MENLIILNYNEYKSLILRSKIEESLSMCSETSLNKAFRNAVSIVIFFSTLDICVVFFFFW